MLYHYYLFTGIYLNDWKACDKFCSLYVSVLAVSSSCPWQEPEPGQWLVSGRRQVFLMDGSSIPCCQSHSLLSQNSQHLHQKSILSIAQLPPQPDEGWTEGKFGHQSKTLEPSLNLLTQSELFFSLFLFFPFIKALNLLFNIVSPPADRGRVYSTGLFEWCCLEVDGVCRRGL